MMLEALVYLVSFVRFKKPPANHAYCSKLFALVICIALCHLYVSGSWGTWLQVLFITGLVSYVDNLLILLLLPAYRVDTKSVFHAWRIRKHTP
jgi:CDP-diacylglycerol--glycerol-3-phosphate 3-phosphatidyltransferase